MRLSVIITTYNRVETLPRAVDSVLSQSGPDFELIVVDDGSTDETPSFLKEMTDPRVIAIHRTNGGLSAARNSGIQQATGEWITFLDDDDVALPGWLEAFANLVDDRVGVTCCAAEFSAPDGTCLSAARPGPMGALFQHQTGLLLAGTFAVRTDLISSVGGFDERLTCSHQTELAMRLMPAMLERGLCIRSTHRIFVRIEHRDPRDRPMSNPEALYEGTQVLLDTHREKISHDPHGRAVLNGVLGVSAARLGHWRHARSALLASARAEPFRPKHWLRLVAAFSPPIARRVWRTSRYRPPAPEVASK